MAIVVFLFFCRLHLGFSVSAGGLVFLNILESSVDLAFPPNQDY
jgi:hypothetical protein